MIWKNDRSHYGIIAKGFHWLLALIVLGLLPLGFYMVSLDFGPFKLDLYWWHKSFGTLLFFLVLLRLVWRLINPLPDHILAHEPWERTLAGIVHILLYIGMIGMPVSGILMSAAADFPRPFFKFFSLPDIVPGRDEALFGLMRTAHEIFAYCLLAAIALHGTGAFKHHFIDGDITLRRMLPVRWPRFGASLALFVFVFLLGSASVLGLQHFLKNGTAATIANAPEQKAAQRPLQEQVQAQLQENSAVSTGTVPQWTILPDQSAITFNAVVQGDDFQGQFTEFGGDIFFDPENLADSHVEVRVKIASVETASEERNEYIVAPVWLNAESFPESVFTASDFEKIKDNQYIAHGALSLRGVRLPVTVPFSLDISENEQGRMRADMQGNFEIERFKYDLGGEAWDDPDMVANTVRISVSLKAEQN